MIPNLRQIKGIFTMDNIPLLISRCSYMSTCFTSVISSYCLILSRFLSSLLHNCPSLLFLSYPPRICLPLSIYTCLLLCNMASVWNATCGLRLNIANYITKLMKIKLHFLFNTGPEFNDLTMLTLLDSLVVKWLVIIESLYFL